MREPERAQAALARAEAEADEIDRTLWLAKAADHAVAGRTVLVGGAAVNLHTQSYRPTDVDMCAHLDEDDRDALKDVGFHHRQGDHFRYDFEDGERWLLEFPCSQVDGDVTVVRLDEDESLEVISLESLIVDRVLKATDGTKVTFVEAVRLFVAVFEETDWSKVDHEIRQRAELEPMLGLGATYSRVMDETRERLKHL